MCDDDGTRCLANKMSNVTSNIGESSATVYESVNYKSTKNMKYDLPYKIMWIGKGLTPYGVKIKVELSGNGEKFRVSLPKRYVGEFSDHFIYLINPEGKDSNLTLTRKQGTKCQEYHFAYNGVVWLT